MRIALSLLLFFSSNLFMAAQTKPVPTPADYGQWESLIPGASYGGLSPDGKWLTYQITRSNRNNELRITNLSNPKDTIIPFGVLPTFSSDSHWIAYGIELPEAAQDKLRKEKKPIHKKLGLLNLASGEQTVMEGIESFAFSPNGAYLAMRRYPPEKKPAPDKKEDADASADAEANLGATLIVRQLADGRDASFGNVAEFAWQDLERKGRLLAMTISAEDKTGNAIQLYNPETSLLRVLDSSPSVYSGIAWRKKSADLAVLRTQADDRYEDPGHVALAWNQLGENSEARHVYDPKTGSGFRAGMRIVSYRKPSWSEEGDIVFLGIAEWDEKPPSAKKPSSEGDAAKGAAAKEEEEPAGVDVWHWRDTSVLPRQKIEAKQDREKSFLVAWHLHSGNLVQLGRALTEEITPLKRQRFAYAKDWTAYAMERTIGRPAADLYSVDVTTGQRTKLRDRILDDATLQASPAGRYLLYFQGGHYWTVNTATHEVVNVTAKAPASFVNRESDTTGQQKPPFGVAGWTKDDGAVILYSKFDLWLVRPDGSAATRLTDGEKDEIRHRYVRLDPDETCIDTSKPIYLSLFGIWTKKSGYAVLQPGAPAAGREEHLVWRDQNVSRLAKARDAETYDYTTETFESSPNIFVGNANLRDPKQVTNTNPFQSKYAWGHSQLIEYKSPQGERLQGALYYPARYEPGGKYPMIVYLYEKLSDQIHRYSVLSERIYYNPSKMTSHGYFVLMPDIVFRPREPGVSVVECVTAALKQVFATGMVDPGKVGVVGHSWGGFDTTFLATHTDLFAAAVAGAPITDLISNYGNHHWRQGIAETDHIETGQQRMQVPLWEDLPAYIRNSAVFNAQNMKTPLLIEVGDNDGTVFFHQGVELYNIARRASKNVVMLVYSGEDHGLSKKQDQIDYQRRIFAWFGYYLKGEPAAPWITGGESYLQRQKYLKTQKTRSEQKTN